MKEKDNGPFHSTLQVRARAHVLVTQFIIYACQLIPIQSYSCTGSRFCAGRSQSTLFKMPVVTSLTFNFTLVVHTHHVNSSVVASIHKFIPYTLAGLHLIHKFWCHRSTKLWNGTRTPCHQGPGGPKFVSNKILAGPRVIFRRVRKKKFVAKKYKSRMVRNFGFDGTGN